MAARKQQDVACMFCFEVPCTCAGLKKKSPATRKKLSPTSAPEIVVPLPDKLETPKIPKQSKPGISKLLDSVKQDTDETEEQERAALTNLFKGGFIVESIDDPKGFESVRPKLNMTPIDIDIQLWKLRRSQCQSSNRPGTTT